MDSVLLRDIFKHEKKVYLSVHDCVLVDLFSVSSFIIAANEVFNKPIFNGLS